MNMDGMSIEAAARDVEREILRLSPLADYLRLSLLDIPEVYACGRLPLRGDVLAVADEFQRAADRLRNLEHTLALLEEQADMLDGHIDGEGIE